MCETLDPRQTLHQGQLENGDILITQRALSQVAVADTVIEDA